MDSLIITKHYLVFWQTILLFLALLCNSATLPLYSSTLPSVTLPFWHSYHVSSNMHKLEYVYLHLVLQLFVCLIVWLRLLLVPVAQMLDLRFSNKINFIFLSSTLQPTLHFYKMYFWYFLDLHLVLWLCVSLFDWDCYRWYVWVTSVH